MAAESVIEIVNPVGDRMPFEGSAPRGGAGLALVASPPRKREKGVPVGAGGGAKQDLTLNDDDMDLDPGVGYQWIVAEPAGALPGGSEVSLCEGDLRLGDRALHTTDDGEVVAVKRVSFDDAQKEAARVADDAGCWDHFDTMQMGGASGPLATQSWS